MITYVLLIMLAASDGSFNLLNDKDGEFVIGFKTKEQCVAAAYELRKTANERDKLTCFHVILSHAKSKGIDR